ncbi:membrane hypothetical protein [Candidatus Sulfopaludibacter sp. SbA4]|nr:membrane hypothetical protein [Candidatus Sulfopaludibacter sp. SbA4]
MKPNHGHLPYSLTIACSSTLLFLVQPIIAKAILPRFGGSAGVWVTCMLFFQVVLLIGYLYSYLITRHLNGKAQTAVHLALLVGSLAVLPLKPRIEWTASGNPLVAILFLLATSVGLPYFVLATTSPLLQSWYAGAGARFPYRLFALSNAASLVALLSYPVAIEPLWPQQQQLLWWSGAYFVFVLLAVLAAVASRAHAAPQAGGKTPGAAMWIALAACASTLWLATANHLSQEVAAIPFLWILPLSLYLLSFILCFEAHGWYRPAIFRWLLPAAWIAVCFRIARQGLSGGLEWEIPVMSAALFVCCMFCHGELAAGKPEPRQGLAWFYLMVALGGALGAVFVGRGRAQPLQYLPGAAHRNHRVGPPGPGPVVRIHFARAPAPCGRGGRRGFRRGYPLQRRRPGRGPHPQLLRSHPGQRHRLRRNRRPRPLQRQDAPRRAIPLARAQPAGDRVLWPGIGRGPRVRIAPHAGPPRGNHRTRRRHAGRIRPARRPFPILRDQPGGDPGGVAVFPFSRRVRRPDRCGAGRWTLDPRAGAAAEFRCHRSGCVLRRFHPGPPADHPGIPCVLRPLASRRRAGAAHHQPLSGSVSGGGGRRRGARKETPADPQRGGSGTAGIHGGLGGDLRQHRGSPGSVGLRPTVRSRQEGAAVDGRLQQPLRRLTLREVKQ